VPRDIHALVQPYQGLVVELVDTAPGRERAECNDWLASELLPDVVGGDVALSLRFDYRPLPADKLGHVREVPGAERMVSVLHFLDVDPRECWDERFAHRAEELAAGGHGTLAVQAAFIPTHHGTDDYTEDLF
jgi:hypothetical protein